MTLQFGLQLHLPTHRALDAQGLVKLGQQASASGFSQIWVTDNVGSRHLFVVLAALACQTDARLGTAVLVQYLHSPTESAAAIGTLAELAGGRGIDVGIGAGNPFLSSTLAQPAPITFMRETVTFLRAAISGTDLAAADFPLLCEYFRYDTDATLRAFRAQAGHVGLLGGGNGPLGMRVAGQLCDGVLMGWTLLPALTIGKLTPLLAVADQAAADAGRPAPVRRVGEVKVAVARSDDAARRWVAAKEESTATRCLSLRRRGYSDHELSQLGIEPRVIDAIAVRAAAAQPVAGIELTEAMTDACFVAGDPARCRERLAEIFKQAEELGFEQLIFSELGPDPSDAVGLLADEILPVLL